MIYLLNVREDVTIEEILKVQKEIMPGRGEIVMTIAEKLRNEGKLEGKVEGKLEGERELIIEILNQRFGEDFDKSLEEKIRNANEETINQIKKNILNVTLEELKELLK
jgi:transcription termination factor NusB